MTKYPSFSGGEKRLPCPRFALRTANSTAAVRRTLALLAPLSSLLLTACGSLTGLDAGSTFNCGKGEGVPCTSVETLSLEHAARTLPYQKEEEARASQAAFENALAAPVDASVPTPFNADAAASKPSALPLDPIAAVKAAEASSPGRQYSAVRLDGKAPGRFPRRIPEVILRLWIAPWTDDAGTFHTAETLYVTVKEARWAEARERRPAQRPAVRLGNASRTEKPADASDDDHETNVKTESGRLLREAKAAFEKTLEDVR